MAPTGMLTPSQTGYNIVQSPKMSPATRQIWEQLLGGAQPGVRSGLNQLSNLASGDQSQFEALEAPAFRQFNALQGNIASRFSGMGQGARHSSGFQNTMGDAATDLAERLQSQRMGLQQSAIDQLLSIYGSLMQNDPYETFLMQQKPKSPSKWQQLLGGILPVAGTALGGIFGGPAGASFGAGVGSAAGKAFM